MEYSSFSGEKIRCCCRANAPGLMKEDFAAGSGEGGEGMPGGAHTQHGLRGLHVPHSH